ncbi:uncharacterized protein LOC141685046 [Apium graveolens]|uniref:uncharacterized protein LOC141685046 n=1 Tax=Apium graveolens TaxID=4045 RepID=UPI003D7B7FB1
MTCFKCEKVGHMSRNCKEPIQKANVFRIAEPPPPPAQTVQPRAQTFNMTIKDAVQDADVVAGTLTINSVEVKVLMDSGATRSFFYENVIDRLKCVSYPLESSLVIEVANQERVTANKICPNCNIVIEGRHFSSDLIPFKLGEFDVILGMDWLANHDAQIECRSKKMKLRSKDGTEVIFKGRKQDKKYLIVIQTRRSLRQGCEAYLAHVKDVEKESLKIENIPVVKEFPDELLGLPPDREIQFTIDLASGTERVSKAPYQMTPSEMKELATQLHELAYTLTQMMDQENDKLSEEEIKAQKDDKGIYRVGSHIWIPNVAELKHEILHEAHNSRFLIHHGSTKMYKDLKENYWWPNMKKEIA